MNGDRTSVAATNDTALKARSRGVDARTSPHACPHCRSADGVQTFRFAVDAATSCGGFAGTTARVDSGSGAAGGPTGSSGAPILASGLQTALGRALMGPTTPADRTPWSGTVIAAILGCGGLGVLSWSRIFGDGGLGSFVTGMVLIAVALVLGADASQQAEDRRARVATERSLADWAAPRWDRLYYCYHCDGVFEPGQTTFVPTVSVAELLRAA
jgi:hypothetical protein